MNLTASQLAKAVRAYEPVHYCRTAAQGIAILMRVVMEQRDEARRRATCCSVTLIQWIGNDKKETCEARYYRLLHQLSKQALSQLAVGQNTCLMWWQPTRLCTHRLHLSVSKNTEFYKFRKQSSYCTWPTFPVQVSAGILHSEETVVRHA